MRCQDTRKQQRSTYAKIQDIHPYCHTYRKRNNKSQCPEDKRPTDVLLQVIQIHFQTCQEHYIIDTDFTEEFKTTVAFQYIKPIFAYCNPCQNHTDDMRNT